MSATMSDQLRDLGARDGDWPEPSLWAPDGYGFNYTGSLRSKTHLITTGGYGYDESGTALCGVGTVWGGGTEQSLVSLLDRDMCPRCVRVLRRQRNGDG